MAWNTSPRVRHLLRRVNRNAGRFCFKDLQVDLRAHRVWRAGQEVELTPREYALLETLVRNRNMALTSIQLLNPMGDPMTLLMISLALGFIQILYGLFIAFSENWKAGDKFAACADQGGWILFLCGLVLFGCAAGGYVPASLALPGKIVAAAGAVILVATQGREKPSIFGKIFSGVMSLYNVTGYLGDVLSYSRLLALGLGSAAVGMVINLLAKLVADVPYVGIVLAVLLFVVGHLFSIAVNLLGAFIHPLRLQYVEFFGKFYDAAGHDFAPLSNAAQYSQISDKSTN